MIHSHFCHSVACLFMLLMISFALQKLFNLMQSRLLTYSVAAFAFGVNLKAIIMKTYVEELTIQVSPYEFNGFRCYVEVFNPLWVNCSVWCKIVDWLYSFSCGCPILQQHQLLKRQSFFHCIFLVLSNSLTIYAWFYFCVIHFVSLIYVSIFMPILYFIVWITIEL